MNQECSNGPVSTLAGHVSTDGIDPGTECMGQLESEQRDVLVGCPDLATVKVQGETDSFGCEYVYLCHACHERMKLAHQQRAAQPEYCEWCKHEKTGVRDHRDIDEGLAGPVYRVCRDCIADELRELRAELDDDDFYVWR